MVFASLQILIPKRHPGPQKHLEAGRGEEKDPQPSAPAPAAPVHPGPWRGRLRINAVCGTWWLRLKGAGKGDASGSTWCGFWKEETCRGGGLEVGEKAVR